jgi:prepilin signal peptidase PulO-like enzyme (type II secretory pathway)
MMLPFGIFLGIGSVTSLLAGTRLIAWYATLFR